MTKKLTSRFALGAAALLLSPVLLAGCGDDAADTTSEATTTTAASDAAASSDVPTLSGTWSRSTADGATAGAVYTTITGGAEDDVLLGALVDTSIASETQIHETRMTEMTDESTTMMEGDSGMDESDDMASGSEMDPSMEMVQIQSLEIPAGGTVELAPGGYHIMMLGLQAPLVAGDTFDVTLTFEKAGEIVQTVEVRDEE